jgi:excisionase family DNA binding protein
MIKNEIHFYQTNPEELINDILKGVDKKLQEFYERLNPSENKEDELLTLDEAIKILKCSNQTLWNWRKQGIIPSHRIGNRIYIYKSDIHAKLIKQDFHV